MSMSKESKERQSDRVIKHSDGSISDAGFWEDWLGKEGIAALPGTRKGSKPIPNKDKYTKPDLKKG